jgi:hypothetical protein
MAAKNRRAGSPRNPRVTSTESIDQAEEQNNFKARLKSEDEQTRPDAVPDGLIETIAAVRKTLQAAGLGALEEYLLRESRDDHRDRPGSGDKAARLRIHMDLIQHELAASPDLRAEFERHALMQDYLRIYQKEAAKDIVAEEIARAVTIKWADRKNPPYRDQPWAWLKRPDLFVAHVYQRWHEAKVLRLKHLAHDEHLYGAYKMTVRRHPERDLSLPREVGEHHRQRPPVLKARLGQVRVPTSRLSEEDKKRRREQETRRKRAYRAKKRLS